MLLLTGKWLLGGACTAGRKMSLGQERRQWLAVAGALEECYDMVGLPGLAWPGLPW